MIMGLKGHLAEEALIVTVGLKFESHVSGTFSRGGTHHYCRSQI